MSVRFLLHILILLTAVQISPNSRLEASDTTRNVDQNIVGDGDLSFVIDKLNQVHCSQLATFDFLFDRYGYIPNSWNATTGALENDGQMIQPRMLQYAMNVLLVNDYLGSEFSDCSREVFKNTVSGIKAFSSDYTAPLPWKKTVGFVDKTDEPMSVYDIGDWLMVVSVAAMVADDPDLTNYLNRVVEETSSLFAIYVQKNIFPGLFSYGYQPTKHQLEVGHATLFLDGLVYAYLASGNKEMLWLAKAYYLTASQRHRQPILENINGKDNYTTLMTYGELLESTNLLYFVTEDHFYLMEGKRLAAEMLSQFLLPSSELAYRRSDDGIFSPCIDAMGLEAATYHILNFYRFDMSDAEFHALFNYIQKFTDHIEATGYVPQLICAPNEHNDQFLIGNQYGVLKTLFYLRDTPSLAKRAAEYGINTSQSIQGIIDQLATTNFSFGFPNALMDETKGIVPDVGGNVWMLNEAVMPILINNILDFDLFNLDKLSTNKYGFVGCNYLFLSPPMYSINPS